MYDNYFTKAIYYYRIVLCVYDNMASVWGVLSVVTMSDKDSELLDNPDSPPTENESPGGVSPVRYSF